jgi:hypothetical protein
LIGNQYQRIANDPPRQDFDQVSESFARLIEESVPTKEPLASVHKLAAHQVMLADALNALLISIERFDGALETGDRAAADRQAKAVSECGGRTIHLEEVIENLSLFRLNQEWLVTREFVAPDSVSLAQLVWVQNFYKGVRGEDPITAPGEPLAAVLASVVDLAESHLLESLDLDLDPLLTDKLPALLASRALPERLVDNFYLQSLFSVNAELQNLVTDKT